MVGRGGEGGSTDRLVSVYLLFRGFESHGWTYLFNHVEDCPSQMAAAFSEAGSFEPAADVWFCQGVCEFFDADDEDWLDRVNIPQDLREAVAVAEEGHDHAVRVEVSVDPDGGLDFGEVFNILAQDLFSDAFVVVVVLFGVGFSSERQGDEVGSCPCGLVLRCCVETCEREFADSKLSEEGSLGFEGNDVMTGLGDTNV